MLLFMLLITGAMLLIAVRTAPWRGLVERSDRQHAFLASLVVLPIVWLGTVTPGEGPGLHLLGMTPLALIFGWALALVIGYLAAVFLAVIGLWAWSALPLELFLSVLVPIAATQILLRAASALPQANLFVYLLGVGFLGGVAAMTASLLLGAALLGWHADHAMVLLLAFPEGFIAGAIVTALTVFYPSIMRTYDDVRYLGDP